jgi:hypothetical protein
MAHTFKAIQDAERQRGLDNQLFKAMESDDTTADEVKKLLRKGANVNARDGKGMAALHWAMDGDDKKTIKVTIALLEAGADVNAQTPDGETPLHTAVSRSNVGYEGDPDHELTKRLVDILLAAGADLTVEHNHSYRNSHTPITEAGFRGNPDIAKRLQSIHDGRRERPTPKEVGVDMEKRKEALRQIDKDERKKGDKASRAR